MREKTTREDAEFKEIAEKLIKKYPSFFPEEINLERFYFMRTEGMCPKWISRIRKCGHPFGSLPGLEEIIYIVETADARWATLTAEQRIIVVLHELKHVPEGGCDFDSQKCGKLVDHPIHDFPECIAAANGNLFWAEPGHNEGLPNILNEKATFDLDAALRRAGVIPDAEEDAKREAKKKRSAERKTVDADEVTREDGSVNSEEV